MTIDTQRTIQTWTLATLFALTLSACATNSNVPLNGAASKTDTKSESSVSNKAIQKISMAIGVEVNGFSIVNRQETEAPMGFEGHQYTVKTTGGKTYKCEILEHSGLGKAITFGTGNGANAMCTDFTQGSKDQGKAPSASCNALLKAANKC